MDGIVTQYGDITIYSDDIAVLCEQYINSLPNPDNIYKSNTFKGLLDYIYRHYLKDIDLRCKDKSNTNNYELLDKLFFDLYLPLVYKYNNSPSVLGFCTMCHISAENISDIRNGVYRSGYPVNSQNSQIVKKWYQVTESSLFDKAVNESSVGSIFLLKSKFSYRETAPLIEVSNVEQIDSPEQIAARHAQSALTMPEKPDL